MIRHQTFFHNNVKYFFGWNEQHLPEGLLGQLIKRYLLQIENHSFPENLFQNMKIPRISRFHLRNSPFTNAWKTLSQRLMNDKLITIPPNSPHTLRAQTIQTNYAKTGIKEKPPHSTILRNFLLQDTKTIAIEIPIWDAKIPLTGHIDLLQICDAGLIVADYKPENHFIVSLPQIATYGLLLRQLFQVPVKCISFSIEQAWEYSPSLLAEKIIPFMERNNRSLNWFPFVKKLIQTI